MLKRHKPVKRRAMGIRVFWYLCLAAVVVTGCSDRSTPPSGEYLIRVNDRSISVDAFNARFDTISAEFPTPRQDDPETDRAMKLRLLHQLVEELILIERAEELSLTISDEELADAVKEIRDDYPAGEFEQVLLEQAISLDTWKAELRKRLLKEKVVRNDLEASVALTPEEIAASYEANYQAQGPRTDQTIDEKERDEKVIKLVRQQKAQDAYQVWMKELQKKYNVHIDEIAWKNLVGS